jgi:hypothetical protein
VTRSSSAVFSGFVSQRGSFGRSMQIDGDPQIARGPFLPGAELQKGSQRHQSAVPRRGRQHHAARGSAGQLRLVGPQQHPIHLLQRCVVNPCAVGQERRQVLLVGADRVRAAGFVQGLPVQGLPHRPGQGDRIWIVVGHPSIKLRIITISRSADVTPSRSRRRPPMTCRALQDQFAGDFPGRQTALEARFAGSAPEARIGSLACAGPTRSSGLLVDRFAFLSMVRCPICSPRMPTRCG